MSSNTNSNTNAFMKEVDSKMKKVIEHTIHNFNSIHAGKASTSMIENVNVDPYGTGAISKLKEISVISTPDARTIVVQPWDKTIIKAIEKAIQTANLGLNPIPDSGILRCPVPELNRERRQDLVKKVNTMAEAGRITIRNQRREGIEHLKKLEKDKIISEDDLKRLEKDVQKFTDNSIKEIDSNLKTKETELLKV